MDNVNERMAALVEQMRQNQSNSIPLPTEADIAQTEHELGVTLPHSYKLFLRSMGFSVWPDYIYGIGAKLLPGLNLVSVNKREREMVEPRLPKRYVAFSSDGWGNSCCLDTSQQSQGECPVVFWNHELDEGQQVKQVSASFLDWLENLIKEEARLIEKED